jgi:inhibitor of KinA
MTTMEAPAWRTVPVGDRCMLISFGPAVDAPTNGRVHAAAAHFTTHPLPGVIDVVPSFTTLALHYLPQAFDPARGLPYDQLRAQVEAALSKGVNDVVQESRSIDIPVCYGGTYGPDLDEVADRCKMTPEEVIRLHGETSLTLFTFYFAPGNPFAGVLDPRLSVPRRKSPRTHVPVGTVAIANNLTCIYQLEMPGGWNLIGRTPWNLFDFKQDPASRLRLGDQLEPRS